MNIFKKITSFALLTISGLAPLVGLAQSVGGVPNVPPLSGGVNVLDIITKVINYAFGFLLLLAVVFIIYAAYLYLIGDDKEKAKKLIIDAVWAIVIGALARGIVFIVSNLIGVNSSSVTGG